MSALIKKANRSQIARTATFTKGRIRKLLDYNPATGLFKWRVDRSRNRCKGKVAGVVDKSSGYRRIVVDGVLYKASRLAVLWMTGSFPSQGLVCDHIDRNRSNDRWKNLRVVTSKQNSWNRKPCARNKSGFVGVCWSKVRYKWEAFISIDCKTKTIGFFEDFDAACDARIASEIEHYGEFSRRWS